MKKNRSNLFKNEPKRPKKSAQLEKNNFPTGKQKFSNWKIIFSQLSFANFPTAFRIENENVNIFFGHIEYVGVTRIPLRGRTRCSDLSHKQKNGIGFTKNESINNKCLQMSC